MELKNRNGFVVKFVKLITTATLFMAILPTCYSIAQEPAFDWEKADREVKRISPARLQGVPANIVAALTRWGYTIPQTYMASGPENAIHGEFRARGETDGQYSVPRIGFQRSLCSGQDRKAIPP